MPTEQSTAHEKCRRTSSIGNIRKTLARNQHQHHRTLPKSNGLNAIVVIVDQFTKMIRLKATMIAISLEDIAKIYKDKIWKLHRVLQKVLSDREPQFTSKFIEDLTKVLETKQTLFMAYHPQTDGQTE